MELCNDRNTHKKGMKQIQFVFWRYGKPHFGYIRGNPLNVPAAFHLIYKWSLWLGWLEVRKFLTDEERKQALNIYRNGIL